jgi:predicted phosphodiesterase
VIDVTDLVVGEDLPGEFEATAIEITTDTARKRRAEVTLEDDAGNQVLFVDYEGAELDIDWQQGTRYRIADCPVQAGDQQHRATLAPGKRTAVTVVDEADAHATLLILGDTHVGRTQHPGNGSRIDPTTAFQHAITVARVLEVDAVVHTGDIFQDDGVSQTELDAVEEGVFAQLAADEIPLYYVTGNHATRASQRFLRQQTAKRDLVTNLTTDSVNVRGAVQLCGVNRSRDGTFDASAYNFPASTAERGVLVLHHTVRQLQPGHLQTPESGWEVDLDDLSIGGSSGFDLVAAGHHHSAKRKPVGDAEAVYTGAAEPMSTQPDADDGLVWLLTIDGGDYTLGSASLRDLVASISDENTG